MWNLIFLRMQRERNLLFMLLLGLLLVTGFLALAPLYVQALAGANFDYRVAQSTPELFSATLRNPMPFAENTTDTVRAALGESISAIRSYAAADNFTCGVWFAPDAEDGNTTHCYRTYAYDNLDSLFTIVDGHLPQPDTNQALITLKTAEETGITVGSRIELRESMSVTISAIVTPQLPEAHPFWRGQTILDIFLTSLSPVDVRADVSFALARSSFNRNTATLGTISYFYQMDLIREMVTASSIDAREQEWRTLDQRIRTAHPGAVLNLALLEFFDRFRTELNRAQPPVLLLATLVAGLLLYNVVTIAALIFEQQAEEWSILASRGGSRLQLVWMQTVTTALIALVASVAGPFIAYALLGVLAVVSAQSLQLPPIDRIPSTSYLLSFLAGTVSIVALMIPAWIAAGKSLAQVKSSLSRPPTKAVWMRIYLDVILLVLGAAFFYRLFHLSGGLELTDLFRDPLALSTRLSAALSANLNDPFAAGAPLLLLCGTILLWMRLFPWLMRAIGSLIGRGDGLTVRLALWTVERDPGHYAQLVLLLISTLIMGTTALVIAHTHERGAWQAAYQDTGADLVLEFAAGNSSSMQEITANIADVRATLPLLVVPTGSNRDGAMIGVDAGQLAADAFPDFSGANLLREVPALNFGGLALPESAESVSLDLYVMPLQDGTDPQLSLLIQVINHAGILQQLPCDNLNAGEWQRCQVSVAEASRPFTFQGIAFRASVDDRSSFQSRLLLDNLVTVDASGNETLLEDFSGETRNQWKWGSQIRFSQILESTALTTSEDFASEGDRSMAIDYLMESTGSGFRTLELTYGRIETPALPVVISAAFAQSAGQRSAYRRPLAAGDTMSTQFVVPAAGTSSVTASISYQVIGIVNSLAGFAPDAPLLIADQSMLRYLLNSSDAFTRTVSGGQRYDVNQLWIDLETGEPDHELVATMRSDSRFSGVRFAWDRYTEIQREPLANAVTGMLFTGFCLSFLLSLIDFAFFMAVTLRRRAVSFGTLRALGWAEGDLLAMLLVEQLAYIIPALVVGVLFGIILSAFLLPLLLLVGGINLSIPFAAIAALVTVILIAFLLLVRYAALWLRRIVIGDVLRFGE